VCGRTVSWLLQAAVSKLTEYLLYVVWIPQTAYCYF